MLATNLFLLLFTIILCIYPLCATAQARIFSYNEKIGYESETKPIIWNQQVYDDGTVVLRIIRENVTRILKDRVCYLEKFSLRIIQLDGKVDEKDFDLGIQPFNYCRLLSENVEFMNFRLIRKNQVLVTYYNVTDLNDFQTYEEWGMIIDLDGNVKSRTSLGFTFVEKGPQQLISNSDITLN